MPYRLGIDTGGTFTDLALVDDSTGEAQLYKLSSTPADPSEAILQGIKEILTAAALRVKDVSYLGHGTTVATNALIEGKVARTALIATDGFRDVIEIARQRRPDLYNLDIDKPKPLAPRDLRVDVRERLRADGSVLLPLDEEQVRKVVRELRQREVTAIAVCFLHSYLNPVHERRVKEIVKEEFPECAVSLSSDVLPEFREYERFITTVMNAALVPVMSRYLGRLEQKVRNEGLPTGPRIMQSSGGVISAAGAGARPINTLFSGPSAGVIGAAHLCARAGFPDIITFDMGGTSTDVCLVEGGAPLITNQRIVARFPVKCPTVDVHSVGAGGGSVGFVDSGGFLRVGPNSAGARPGPACYGLGGLNPTVTDANVILGRQHRQHLLGGRMPINAALSEAAMLEKVAKPLGMDLITAAQGMLRVVNSNIIRAIRVISVEKGYDPRQFVLVAFGGGGPLHAAQLARDLEIPTVLVPESPGVLCALGLLVADLRVDFGRTFLMRCSTPNLGALNAAYKELDAKLADWLKREDAKRENTVVERSADMHFVGQDYELSVAVPPGELDASAIELLVQRFHAKHEEVHGYAPPDQPVEIMALRLVAQSKVSRPSFRPAARVGPSPAAALIGAREVYFEDTTPVECPLYDRARLAPGNELHGPAIIEQMDSTTVIFPGQRAEIDEYRNILIREG
jgi:N-methylhydantoinase A